MCKRSLTLRALVNARLTAAAEEIFALVERTIAEYEEELCRSKEENQRNQQLLDSVLKTQLHTTEAVQLDTFSPESSVKQETPKTPQIKEEPEEQRLKQEKEHLPECTAVCVKSEESEEQTDNSSDTDNEKDWEPPASSSTAQMETEADGDHYNQVQIKDTSPAAHNSGLFSKYKCGAESRATVTEGHGLGTGGGGGGGGDKKHECAFCLKEFKTRQGLEIHVRTHTGERPYSCSVCKKSFTQTQHLKGHMRVHARKKTRSRSPSVEQEKKIECPVCKKTYTTKQSLEIHRRTHTGERPFSCPVCQKTFTRQTYLDYHVRVHTGEKPFSCSICMRTFSQKSNFNEHMKIHTGRSRSRRGPKASGVWDCPQFTPDTWNFLQPDEF